MAQTTPRPSRSLEDMNVHAMVFELQGSVGEIKNAIKNIERALEKGFDGVETTLKDHGSSIHSIHRVIWMVTGGALVVGAIVGVLAGIGIGNVGHFLFSLGGGAPS